MRLRLDILALLLVAACGHNVGDSCTQNVDCSTLGDRFCDLSAPGGYCTVEGCDVGTCPSEASCVRFFQPQRSRPCDPAVAYTSACATTRPLPAGCCEPSERCEGEPGGGGYCAPESSERRWCMLTCSDAGDCRDGYECRSTGTGGAEPVPTGVDERGVPTGPAVKFCVQRAY